MALLRRSLALLLLAAIGTMPAAAQSPPPLKTTRAHRAITTTSPAAQAAFDRALAFLYAFNIGAARAGFREAERLDPQAALPYFGEAISDTFDINRPTTPDGERRGADAVARGLKITDAPSDERALLLAAQARFDPRKTLDQRYHAFFAAMQAYVDAHPSDGMGDVVAVDAGWLATDTLTDAKTGALVPAAKTMAADLDAALALDPDDVGAHHLRIHLWEDAHDPQHALSDAEYLRHLAFLPGESHLVHMPGHIYARLGDYANLIACNEAAYANDDAYFASGDGPGQTYMHIYHMHDAEFVVYGLTTIGDDAGARAFARTTSVFIRLELAMRMHDYTHVLALDGTYLNAYRVVAEARLGKIAAAEHDLHALKADEVGNDGLAIARAAVALAEHQPDAAIADFRAAQKAIGSDLGDPKNFWAMPPGEGLGVALLASGRAADAERVFSDDLVRYPNDPRIEFGLAEALKAEGKDDTAARAASAQEWKGERPLTLADLG